jgi:hypothetical protein
VVLIIGDRLRVRLIYNENNTGAIERIEINHEK